MALQAALSHCDLGTRSASSLPLCVLDSECPARWAEEEESINRRKVTPGEGAWLGVWPPSTSAPLASTSHVALRLLWAGKRGLGESPRRGDGVLVLTFMVHLSGHKVFCKWLISESKLSHPPPQEREPSPPQTSQAQLFLSAWGQGADIPPT